MVGRDGAAMHSQAIENEQFTAEHPTDLLASLLTIRNASASQRRVLRSIAVHERTIDEALLSSSLIASKV